MIYTSRPLPGSPLGIACPGALQPGSAAPPQKPAKSLHGPWPEAPALPPAFPPRPLRTAKGFSSGPRGAAGRPRGQGPGPREGQRGPGPRRPCSPCGSSSSRPRGGWGGAAGRCSARAPAAVPDGRWGGGCSPAQLSRPVTDPRAPPSPCVPSGPAKSPSGPLSAWLGALISSGPC